MTEIASDFLMSDWASSLSGRSPSTISAYCADVRAVAAQVSVTQGRPCRPIDLLHLDDTGLERIAQRMLSLGAAASTVRRRLVALRRYAAFRSQHDNAYAPILFARFPFVDLGPESGIEDEALNDVLEGPLRGSQWWDSRDAAILVIVKDSGLSTGELCRLNGSDVVAGMLIVTSRTGERRFVRLSSEAEKHLAAYAHRFPHPLERDEALFRNSRGTRLSERSIQLMVRRRRNAAGLMHDVVVGTYRHRRIVELARARTPLALIGPLMGIGPTAALSHVHRK